MRHALDGRRIAGGVGGTGRAPERVRVGDARRRRAERCCSRRDPVGGAARALHRGGLAGAAATVFGVSSGACSVTGCGAPVIPVLGLAFVGLESGTLHFLAESSRVATIALLVVLVLAVGHLGRSTCAVRENGRK